MLCPLNGHRLSSLNGLRGKLERRIEQRVKIYVKVKVVFARLPSGFVVAHIPDNQIVILKPVQIGIESTAAHATVNAQSVLGRPANANFIGVIGQHKQNHFFGAFKGLFYSPSHSLK